MRRLVRLGLGFVVAAPCLGFVGTLAGGCGGASDDPALTNGATDGSSTTQSDSANNNSNNDSGSNGSDAGDAGDTIPSDGGSEGGPGGNLTTLTCGSATCSIPTQTCCVTNPPGPNNFTFACVTGTCPIPDAGQGGNNNGDPPIALKCSGQANCAAGTVCCVSTNNKTPSSECQASCGGNGNEAAQLCDPNAPVASNGCSQAKPCSTNNVGEWGLPNTFGTCGGVGN